MANSPRTTPHADEAEAYIELARDMGHFDSERQVCSLIAIAEALLAINETLNGGPTVGE